jgi:sigma-B regulation protein RsbU (phosphoserine phosphatase)
MPTQRVRHGTDRFRGIENPDLRAIGELRKDLGDAAEVQASLLPQKIPQIPGYDIFAFYRSAKEMGGDYYDFIPVDNERLALAVADVSGKGVQGAMIMACTRTLLRMLSPQYGSALDILRLTNVQIARDIKRGMFVTAMLAILNVRTREFWVASAGHNPMVYWHERTQKCHLVNPGGIALGFDRGPVFDRVIKETKLRLEPGDRFVMYTDGVVEAMNAQHEEFTEERFYRFVLQNARLPSKEFTRTLIADVDGHQGAAEQHDDITVLTARVSPDLPASASDTAGFGSGVHT